MPNTSYPKKTFKKKKKKNQRKTRISCKETTKKESKAKQGRGI